MDKYKLNMSRVFKCDAKTVYEAIAEGALFKCTNALMDRCSFDFKEGGALYLEWDGCGPVNGEFKVLEPHSRIVFSWDFHSNETDSDMKTEVEVNIAEHEGVSTLSLVHSGFESGAQLVSHNGGWDNALKALRQSFKELFAELESNQTGLDLYFKQKQVIDAPIEKVFDAVRHHKEMSSYFAVKCSGDLNENSEVEWRFEGHDPFTIVVQQVIPHEVIKFRWGMSHVCFSFRVNEEHKTEVTIEGEITTV